MLKDEFKYDDDLPREKTKPKKKRGRNKNSKQAKDITIPISEKIRNKLREIETQNLKLIECLKTKEKRIKKLENYFWFRNRLIASVAATLLIFSPIILMALFTDPVEFDSANYPLVTNIFLVIGVSTFACGELVIWILASMKIWEGWMNR